MLAMLTQPTPRNAIGCDTAPKTLAHRWRGPSIKIRRRPSHCDQTAAYVFLVNLSANPFIGPPPHVLGSWRQEEGIEKQGLARLYRPRAEILNGSSRGRRL